MSLADACKQEIVDLHRFFEHWFFGGFADPDRGFARFEQVMAPGFVIVSPRGVATPRDALVTELRGAFGAWKRESPAQGPRWTIEVDELAVRHVRGDVAVLTYVEKQFARGHATARLSTAVMQRHEAAPAGVCWLHVHETWLPGGAPPA